MKKLGKKLFVLGGLFLAIAGTTWAEDVELEKIVVTPSRIEESYADISRNIDVITARDIERSGAQDLAGVLTGFTSVNISNYGGLGATKTIRMRGSTAAQVLVLVDGRPINNPRDGEADLSNIPIENIDRIEVMHGPGSSLYGAGAMGGTVNIITKNPPKEKRKTELYSSFGTFRAYTERLSHGGRISNFGYLLTGEYQSSEGFRDNSEFNAKDFNTKFEYEINGENTLTLNSGFYRSKVGTPYKITMPDLDDKQKILKNFLDLNWQCKPTDVLELSAKIYENYDRLEFIENTTDFTKDIHTTKARGLNLQYSQKFTNIYQLICGFNYVTNLNDSTASAKHKYIVRAGYLENQLDLFKNLKLSFGARVDDYSNFGSEVCPSFSFLYKFNEDTKLRGLIARSFRAPTLNDLYWPRKDYYYMGVWVGGEEGNPNLKPEKGITGEFGIETKVNKYLLSSLTYYRNDYNNLINWVDESSVWKPKNIGSAVIDGIEFENKIYFANNLELNLGYTYLRAKDEKTHKDLIYQPKHKLDCSLIYKDLNGFVFELKGQFTDKRFHSWEDPATYTQTIKVKRFFVLGINVSKKFKPGFTYFISIDNLLNKKYQVIRDYPMPGFSLTSGIKLEF